jgi:hypothetical protein
MMSVGVVVLVLAISVLLLAIAAARAFKVMASHRDRLAALERKGRSDGTPRDSTHIVH